MISNTVSKLVVLQCLSEISADSADGLHKVDQSGLMRRMLCELDSDDILSHLNCLEMLTTFAVTAHGYGYLQEQGVFERLDEMIGDIDMNPLGSLLLPGMPHFQLISVVLQRACCVIVQFNIISFS